MQEEYIAISAFSKQLNVNNMTIVKAIKKGVLRESIKIVNGKPKINFQKGVIECRNNGIGLKSTKISMPNIVDTRADDQQKVSREKSLELTYDKDSYQLAAIHEKTWKAKKAEIEVLKLQGEFYPKKKVIEDITSALIAMRDQVMLLPDKINDIISLNNEQREHIRKLCEDTLWNVANLKNKL